MFADDRKIGLSYHARRMLLNFRKIWTMSSSWSAKWLLKFNPLRCKLMHLRHNMDTKYHIIQDGQKWNIEPVQQEKDLGVLTSCYLYMFYQCMEAASKTSRVLGMVLSLIHI